jgi:hypothetical protein
MTFINEGTWDRVIRVAIGCALAYAAWLTWPGIASMAFLIIAAMALLTGFIGWCMCYAMCGISTAKKTIT